MVLFATPRKRQIEKGVTTKEVGLRDRGRFPVILFVSHYCPWTF